jgi:NDP-sugar pyrophosphorylase family protein
VPWSIERSYFPSLVERGETFVAHVDDGYWIDIGTPEKYVQVHRDIMDGRFTAEPFAGLLAPRTFVSPDATIENGALVQGPCFIDAGVLVKAGARIGPHSVLGRHTHVAEDASVDGAILWPGCHVGRGARVQGAIAGHGCHIGERVSLNGSAVLGDMTTLTDYTRA